MVNAANFLNLGLSRCEDVLGKTDFDLLPRHIAAQFRADDERVLAGQAIAKRVELIGGFDHTARWSVTFKLPLRDARGRIVGTAGITRPLEAGGKEWRRLPLGDVIAFIRDRFRDPLDNRQLARVAGLSQSTFERRFRRSYGLSPQQYVKLVRVRTACQVLVHTDQSIARIAAEHGLADKSCLVDVNFILPDMVAKAIAGMPTPRAMAWAEDQVRQAIQGKLETKGRP
jgi:AraC-like DNA-binding protein